MRSRKNSSIGNQKHSRKCMQIAHGIAAPLKSVCKIWTRIDIQICPLNTKLHKPQEFMYKAPPQKLPEAEICKKFEKSQKHATDKRPQNATPVKETHRH